MSLHKKISVRNRSYAHYKNAKLYCYHTNYLRYK
nr:MAG TPA: hypothetical protein [Bacteriophage sp.]